LRRGPAAVQDLTPPHGFFVLATLNGEPVGCGAPKCHNKTLTEAQSLYKSNGHREVRPFNDEPYAHHWFEKAL